MTVPAPRSFWDTCNDLDGSAVIEYANEVAIANLTACRIIGGEFAIHLTFGRSVGFKM
jgi:hypothetical protein